MSHSATTGAAQAAAAALIARRPSAAVPLLLGPAPSPAPPATPPPPGSPPWLLFSPSLPAAGALKPEDRHGRLTPTQDGSQDITTAMQSEGRSCCHDRPMDAVHVTSASCAGLQQTPGRIQACASMSGLGRPPGASDQGGQAAAHRRQRGRKRGALEAETERGGGHGADGAAAAVRAGRGRR